MIAIDIETATNIELDAVCIQADGQMNGATYDPDLAAMNARFAVVKIGGKTRVVELEDNPACPGSKMPVFSTIADFCSFQAKRRKNVGTDDNPDRVYWNTSHGQFYSDGGLGGTGTFR